MQVATQVAATRRLKSAAMHSFAEGDRVRAARRADFPAGTVLRVMDLGYLLVRWDSNVLETAHHAELVKVTEKAGAATP
jgi:hypothetical protein